VLAINSQAYQDFCSEDVEEQVWTSDPTLGLATMKEPNALAAAVVVVVVAAAVVVRSMRKKRKVHLRKHPCDQHSSMVETNAAPRVDLRCHAWEEVAGTMMRVHLLLLSWTRVMSSQATDLGFARSGALILVASAHDQASEVCRGRR